MSAKYGRHDRAMSECEHQGALRDAIEPAYNVAKPRLTVLVHALLTFASNFISQIFQPIKVLADKTFAG